MRVEDWGRIEYTAAVEKQLELVSALADRKPGAESVLVFCSHDPVVTVGRGTKPGDIFGWQGPVVETSRGGRATYHGPNQIVCYPILNLSQSRDLHAYLRALEEAIVQTLREFSVEAQARTIKVEGEPSLTGVWVNENGRDLKIASIGIAVKKWITYHGLALNVSYDPLAFTGINPCGFSSEVMTSMEQTLGKTVARQQVQATLARFLEQKLAGFDTPLPEKSA